MLAYIENVVREFNAPGNRTGGCMIQDWAVNLAWGGIDELVGSGMMDIQQRNSENGRAESSGTYDADKAQRLTSNADNANRQMRRRVVEHGLEHLHARAPAAEFYWAVVASLVDDGEEELRVFRKL